MSVREQHIEYCENIDNIRLLLVFRKDNGKLDAYSLPFERVYELLNGLSEEEKSKIRPHEL